MGSALARLALWLIVVGILLACQQGDDSGDTPPDAPTADGGAVSGRDSGTTAGDSGATAGDEDAGTVAVSDGGSDSPDTGTDTSRGTFACTEVIGFSQTIQWYTAGFETYVADEYWQRRAQGGASIDLWADPEYSGWDIEISSACAGGDEPDRVVQTVSGAYGDDVDAWEEQIRAAVAAIRVKHPGVRQIVLQSVVGGPGGTVCMFAGRQVRANYQFSFINEAIARVAEGDVVTGPAPEIETCDQYRDAKGHLTDEGSRVAARVIGQHYAELDGR
jgi:hypothetical protein